MCSVSFGDLMVRDAPQAALLTMRVSTLAFQRALVLRSPPEAGVSTDGGRHAASPGSRAGGPQHVRD
ncbi:hypothetical protein BRAS3809_4840005 [Bradyrhizobium sp. STM 3809]|nr:hypothetical protein BRAS3809_4840005 [Bradyrhizobium sp. STM 3809]